MKYRTIQLTMTKKNEVQQAAVSEDIQLVKGNIRQLENDEKRLTQSIMNPLGHSMHSSFLISP